VVGESQRIPEPRALVLALIGSVPHGLLGYNWRRRNWETEAIGTAGREKSS